MLGSLSWLQSLAFVAEKLYRTTWRDRYSCTNDVQQVLCSPELQLQISKLSGIPQHLNAACEILMNPDIRDLCHPDCITNDGKQLAAGSLRDHLQMQVGRLSHSAQPANESLLSSALLS